MGWVLRVPRVILQMNVHLRGEQWSGSLLESSLELPPESLPGTLLLCLPTPYPYMCASALCVSHPTMCLPAMCVPARCICAHPLCVCQRAVCVPAYYVCGGRTFVTQGTFVDATRSSSEITWWLHNMLTQKYPTFEISYS